MAGSIWRMIKAKPGKMDCARSVQSLIQHEIALNLLQEGKSLRTGGMAASNGPSWCSQVIPAFQGRSRIETYASCWWIFTVKCARQNG